MQAKGGGREGAEGLREPPLLGRGVWSRWWGWTLSLAVRRSLSGSLGTEGLSFQPGLGSRVFSQREWGLPFFPTPQASRRLSCLVLPPSTLSFCCFCSFWIRYCWASQGPRDAEKSEWFPLSLIDAARSPSSFWLACSLCYLTNYSTVRLRTTDIYS